MAKKKSAPGKRYKPLTSKDSPNRVLLVTHYAAIGLVCQAMSFRQLMQLLRLNDTLAAVENHIDRLAVLETAPQDIKSNPRLLSWVKDALQDTAAQLTMTPAMSFARLLLSWCNDAPIGSSLFIHGSDLPRDLPFSTKQRPPVGEVDFDDQPERDPFDDDDDADDEDNGGDHYFVTIADSSVKVNHLKWEGRQLQLRASGMVPMIDRDGEPMGKDASAYLLRFEYERKPVDEA
jgi:hypothetical protein